MKRVYFTFIPDKEVNFKEKQWLQHKKVNDLIVLCHGENTKDADFFIGTALPCFSFPYGHYDTNFLKEEFSLLVSDINFIISND